MNDDINKRLSDVLSKMKPQELQKLIGFAKSGGIASKLTPNDRQKIINEFSKLSESDIKRKLSGINANDLSNLSADNLIKKLRNL